METGPFVSTYLASNSRDRAASRPHQQALTISSHTKCAPDTETTMAVATMHLIYYVSISDFIVFTAF